MNKTYKYIYTVKTNGIEFEVRANESTEALSLAKIIANALGRFIVGISKKEAIA